MSQIETEAAQVEGAAPQKRGPGRPRRNASEKAIKKVRKPYGMKNSLIMEKGGSVENLGSRFRGFKGECVKLKVVSNNGEARFPQILDIKLGDLPQIHIVVNREVIVPIEALGVLNDTTVEVPKSGNVGPEDGPRETETFVRITTMVLGPATWDEYEAFLAKERDKPITPEKRR